MEKAEFEKRHNVRLRCKGDLWWANAIARFWPAFNTRWWTTIRFPGQPVTIAYPVGINPMQERWRIVRAHELVHASQQRGLKLYWFLLLYFVLPLPVLFSGRWFFEREAYLIDILNGSRSVSSVVNTLWGHYLWPWPRKWMRRWFQKRYGR